jgi:hypothetical protein
MRRRLCNGKNCVGSNQEWRTCNSEPCKGIIIKDIILMQIVFYFKQNIEK